MEMGAEGTGGAMTEAQGRRRGERGGLWLGGDDAAAVLVE